MSTRRDAPPGSATGPVDSPKGTLTARVSIEPCAMTHKRAPEFTRTRAAPELTGPARAVLPLQGAHPICYPLMEVRRAHDSLYPGKPHIVSDNVAHTRESEGDTLAL